MSNSSKACMAIAIICAVLCIACIALTVVAGLQGRSFGGLVGSWFRAGDDVAVSAPGGDGSITPSPNGVVACTSDSWADEQQLSLMSIAAPTNPSWRIDVQHDDYGYMTGIYTQWTTRLTNAGGTDAYDVQSAYITVSCGGVSVSAAVPSGRLAYGSHTFSVSDIYRVGTIPGGNYTITVSAVYSGRGLLTSDPLSISVQTPASLPTPSKVGYDFAGWYLDAACTNPYNGGPILSDTTMYARWTIHTYTITLDVAGGVAMDPITADYGASINPAAPTREGYDFTGWYYNDTLWDVNRTIDADLTLVAGWKTTMLTVTLVVDGEPWQTLSVAYGTRFASILEQAGGLYKNVVAIRLADGSEIAADNNMALMADNVTLDLVPMTVGETIQAVGQYNWYSLLGIALTGATSIACAAIARKRS